MSRASLSSSLLSACRYGLAPVRLQQGLHVHTPAVLGAPQPQVGAIFTSLGLKLHQSRRSSVIVGAAKKPKDIVDRARKQQRAATEVLAALLQAPDKAVAAQEFTEDLTEEFFMMASAYLDMAKKEGNNEVADQMQKTLEVAMKEKEKSLRPEIRLLNALLRAKEPADRRVVFQQNGQALTMDDGYFFKLLAMMTNDVTNQKGNPQRESLLAQLKAILEESTVEKENLTQE